MDEVSVHPETRAGDPFAAADGRFDHPHACLNGYVYLGFTYLGEDGEEYEAYERIPCRRCAESYAPVASS